MECSCPVLSLTMTDPEQENSRLKCPIHTFSKVESNNYDHLCSWQARCPQPFELAHGGQGARSRRGGSSSSSQTHSASPAAGFKLTQQIILSLSLVQTFVCAFCQTISSRMIYLCLWVMLNKRENQPAQVLSGRAEQTITLGLNWKPVSFIEVDYIGSIGFAQVTTWIQMMMCKRCFFNFVVDFFAFPSILLIDSFRVLNKKWTNMDQRFSPLVPIEINIWTPKKSFQTKLTHSHRSHTPLTQQSFCSSAHSSSVLTFRFIIKYIYVGIYATV